MRSHKSQQAVAWNEVIAALFILFVLYLLFNPLFYMSHHENAHRASCQSNMKQLGLAFIQYEQDSDQQTPPGVNAAGNGWAGEIYPCIKSKEVYHCPAEGQDGSYISYMANRNAARKPLSQFASPSATVLLYEAATLNCDPSTAETMSATGIIAPQDSKRHNDEDFGLNFLLMDGHVKYLRPGQVSNGPNAVSAKQMPQGMYQETFAIK